MRKHGIIVAAALAFVAFFSTIVAFAAPQIAQQTMRTLPRSFPSPMSSITPVRAVLGRPLPPLPPMPSGKGRVRRIQSATGACIQFSYNTNCSSSGNVNQNYVAGQSVTWKAINLPSSGVTYKDYVLAPGSGTPTLLNTYTATSGPSETTSGLVNGVYVLAALNTTANTWDAIAYILVGSAVSIATYSDGTLANKTETFTTDSTGKTTVYISTTGLTPQDVYAVGVEEQLGGRCVFTAPSSSQAVTPSTLCNLSTSGLTGANPNGGGGLIANWGVTLGSGTTLPQGGTYMATVFDQTTGQRVASRQFTVVDGRATSTGRTNLQFHNGAGTTSSASSATRIAFNGTATSVNDPNQTYMTLYFGAAGLPASSPDSYTLVVSDPNGNVAKSFTGIGESSGTTTIIPSNNQWNLPTQGIPFEQAYPGSTWTATVYDATSKALTAEQSFQVLGYSASVLFDSPTSSSLDIANNTSSAAGITFTNTADSTFGANAGDPITKIVTTASGPNNVTAITLTPPSTGTLCTPAAGANCTGTYSDTSGNAWTATLSCGSACGTYSITLTPVGASTTLLPGASVDVTGLNITNNANACKNVCTFTSSITAQDMISGLSSAGNNVVNPITVENTPGASGAAGNVAVKLAGYYDSGNAYHTLQDAGYTPRFNQAIMENNQAFTNAASKIVFSYTVKDTTSKYIQVFDMALPSAFNASTLTVDSHTPNGASVTDNGTCVGITRPTVCVTPSALIAGGTSQTFYFAITPPSASFSYTDIVGTIVEDQSGTPLTPLSPASSSIATFIGSPSSVDSTALGAYSLSGGLMLGAMTPGSVGTGTTNNLSFTLRNTLSGADPFPDEVDFVELQVPNQSYISVPTACSALTVNTAGWSCLSTTYGSGLPTTYTFGQCPQQLSPLPSVPATSTSFGSDNMTVCPFALPNEPYSLAASGTLSVTIPTTAGATQTPTGSPVTISAWAHGATTNAWTTPITSSLTVTPSAAAGVGFSSISGATGSQQAVPTGTEPQIVGNFITGSPNYNTYIYKVHNTGNTPITSIVIAIPGQDSTGSNGQDSSGNIWNVVTGSVTLTNETTGNTNGCTVTSVQNPSSGTDTTGNMTLSCPSSGSTGLQSGQTLDVQFNASAPLKVNSTYNFPATINSSTTAASANWFADTSVLIALSANVSVAVNGSAVCAGVTLTPATSTINFGTVPANTSSSCADAMIASVTTDASSPSSWALYVSTDANPARTGAGSPNEMNVETDTAKSTNASTGVPCPTSVTPPCFAYDNTSAYTPMGLTSGTGTRLGYTINGGTGVDSSAVNIYVNLQISIGTETVPTTGHTQTLTYTWIAN